MTSASSKSQFTGAGDRDSSTNESNLPLWPEWTDAFLNNVNWGSKPVKKPVSPGHKAPALSPVEVPGEDLYEDPAGLVELLPEMPLATWLRPHQIDVAVNYVVEPDPTPLDLLTHNKHLIGYKMIQIILESIMCLEREAFHRSFPVEFQSAQFVATGGSQWKPWNHVYAHTTAGKGQTHKTQYNRCGKYIVRLFHLGKWRRIEVDDQLPITEEGQLLLPTSRPDNLWLPLLTKALLRVIALSWDPNFSVIHCLTGWLPTTVPCKACDEYQLWCAFCSLMPSTEEVIHSPGGCISDRSFHCSPDDTLTHLEAVGSRVIIAVVISPSICISNSGMMTSASKVDHLVLASNVRYNSELPNPLWKEYRWKEWAFSKGIISDMTSKPIRNIQVYNPLKVPFIIAPNEEVCAQNENEFWMDFDKFVPFLRVLNVYYKPSYFKYSLRAYSTMELLSSPQVADDVLIFNRGRKTSQDNKDKKALQGKSKSKSPNSKKDESVAKTKEGTEEKNKNDKKKTLKTKDKPNVLLEWPMNNYKPPLFYLSIDSMTCKQLYICLSAYEPHKPTYAHVVFGKFEWHSPTVAPIVFLLNTASTKGHMITLSPGLEDVCLKSDCLQIKGGMYSYLTLLLQHILKTNIILLQVRRCLFEIGLFANQRRLHMFRVWHQLPQHFYLQIVSNTAFSTGTKFYIQNSLVSDTMSYTHYGNEIINRFEQLLNAPRGGIDHGKAFDNLMNCLQPPYLTRLQAWPLWFSSHLDLTQAFEESLIEILIELSPSPDEVYSSVKDFQMLFLNPVFGEGTLMALKQETYDFIKERQRNEDQKEILKEQETKEKVFQVSGKKGRDKSPKSDKKGKGNNKGPQKIYEKDYKTTLKSAKTSKQKGDNKGKAGSEESQLRKLLKSTEKNLLLNDQNHAISILKKVMEKLPHLRELYPFRYEDDYKLIYKDYIGELHTSEKWVVVARCKLNLHSMKRVPCSIHIWAPLEKLVHRLINNDTQEDIPLGFVENRVAYLSKNEEGYTLCVYGTTNSASVAWRLRSLGVGEFDMLHVCQGDGCKDSSSQPPQLQQQTLHGFYVPNKDCLVTRCLLIVFSDVTVLLRLHLTDPSVYCSLKIYDSSGNYVENTTGIGHIVLPIIKLEGTKQTEAVEEDLQTANVYQVEVKVLNHSWPLSAGECRALLYYKEHWPDIQLSHTSATQEPMLDSLPLSSPKPVGDADYEFYKKVLKPSWSLTVVTDFQQVPSVNLQLDMSLYDSLQQFKSQWKEDQMDPPNCKQQRQDFLNKISEEEEQDWSEAFVFHLKSKKTDHLTELYGQIVSPIFVPEYLVSYSTSMTSGSSGGQSIAVSESTRTDTKSLMVASVGDVQSLPKVITEDPRNMLVQQTGLHNALESMKMKTLKHQQELMEEMSLMRTQLLNDMKLAKEAKPNKLLEAKEAKSKKSPSPDGKKNKSVKDSKKPKSKK